LLVVIGITFCKQDPIAIGSGEIVNHHADSFAGTAPGCPKVNQSWLVRLQHQCLKAVVINFQYIFRHGTVLLLSISVNLNSETGFIVFLLKKYEGIKPQSIVKNWIVSWSLLLIFNRFPERQSLLVFAFSFPDTILPISRIGSKSAKHLSS
jgi:hypothetical protein